MSHAGRTQSRPRRAAPCLALALLLPGTAPAQATSCQGAAIATASAQGVPADLLQSIVQVESAGQPYAVNVDGAPHVFADKQDAIDFVRTANANGARFIDVGCFQIDLAYHPDAFTDLAAAFDPNANAAYAARFLIALRGTDPDWGNAVAAYHSRTPQLGAGYRDRVAARYAGFRYQSTWPGIRVETPNSPVTPRPGLPRVFVP